MQQNPAFGELVIAGGGPVGNFTAVLTTMLGIPCTVYEKRDSYTREINLKIQKDFFKRVSKTMKRISRREIPFFEQLSDEINSKNGKIVLKELELKLREEAERLGAKYLKKQIKSFQQIDDLHVDTNPLIVDCTGRNSLLRVHQFGNDMENMKIYNLHHALHINFKAHVPRNFDFKLIYPVIKNSDNLKLGQIIVSKDKLEGEDYYSHVTVPLFISESLSTLIDEKYPNINRVPLRPFAVRVQDSTLAEQVQEVISSLFCALVMQDWDIQWFSVVIKKINITCGYGIKRSSGRYVCLGDSAAHFAYFKSLNFGLDHAFEFIKILSSYHSIKYNLGPFDEKLIVDRCWKQNPYLWPIHARQGPSPCLYFITTAQLKILAPYIYDISNDSTMRIDLLPQVKQQKIQQKFAKYNEQVREKDWTSYLQKFENIRKFAIDTEIISNRNKKAGAEVISYFIWINGLSPIKLAQTLSYMTNGYYLEKKDFQYFNQMIQTMRTCMNDWASLRTEIQKKVSQTISKEKLRQKLPIQLEQFLCWLSKKCEDEESGEKEICKEILRFSSLKKDNKIKEVLLLVKVLQIIAYVLLKKDEEGRSPRQERMIALN